MAFSRIERLGDLLENDSCSAWGGFRGWARVAHILGKCGSLAVAPSLAYQSRLRFVEVQQMGVKHTARKEPPECFPLHCAQQK